MTQTEIINELDYLIHLPQISGEELAILKNLKIEYQNDNNISRVVHGIKSSLTPLAIQGKLSKESTAFFKNLAQNNFWNKGTGINPFSV